MEEKIMVNGSEYVLASSVKNTPRLSVESKKYVIARTYSAVVFAGYLKSRKGMEVTLQDARRLWQWQGAATLSNLATEGTKKPTQCKFPAPVDEVLLTQCIELLPVTKKAQATIAAVPEWKV